MGFSSRLRESIALRIKQIQTIEDANLHKLPTSSRLILAPALTAMAKLYNAQESTRQFLYRAGFFHAQSLSAPVISIGNLTSASGKTPYVEYLARHYLLHHNLPSLIIQLGSGNVDETIMLKHSFDGQPVHVTDTSSPYEAKQILLENPSLRLVLLDNGLQHLNLLRDLDIVTLNSMAPFGNKHLRPRGMLREPASPALKRSDVAVIHHVDIAGKERLDATMRMLGPMLPRHVIQTKTQMMPISLRSLVPRQRSLDMSEFIGLGDDVELSCLKGAAVVCLTGVGDPSYILQQTVEEHLRRLGAIHVEGCGAHEDHHIFELDEILEAIDRVRQLSRDPRYKHACILLTEKDYARQYDLWSSVFSGIMAQESDESRNWGAYELRSEIHIVEHDKRFSSQKAVLAVMLRLAMDNYRRRSIMT